MIQPETAPVAPRVVWPETGDTVPIDEIFHRMEGKPAGAIEIFGDIGSGKTTALRHLAAMASREREIVWVDDANLLDVVAGMKDGWVVYTSQLPFVGTLGPSFCLAGWGDDERIEYLLSTHPDRCQSVIVRLGAADDRSVVGDSPLLWRIVLDEMAEHESIRGVDDALWRRLMRVFPEGDVRHLAEEYCFASLALHTDHAEHVFRKLQENRGEEELQLLCVPRIGVLLAADYLARWLEASQEGPPVLPAPSSVATLAKAGLLEPAEVLEASLLVLPQELVVRIAEQIADSPPALDVLRKILAKGVHHLQPMAASILHASGTGWIPERKSRLFLDSAYLQHATWPGVDLRGIWMKAADLSGSGLARAYLDGIQAGRSSFRGASLAEASLVKIVAQAANFSGADLTRANLQEAELGNACFRKAILRKANLVRANLQSTDLRGASFAGANLRQARFSDADITGTDFSSANLEEAYLHGLDLREALLDEACLAGASLGQCNLEGMQLTGVDFTAAKLSLALLSGCIMKGGTLRRAELRCAGLADVQWEDTDLREADFRNAVFHMGSSRSGKVDSPLASEGTRTGFYTDDFEQQAFQSPEHIRKANLCGADLRGANIDGVDFYLVDLRGAKYDAEQLEHFRRCRAILADRG